jgi:hypothetical protein
MLLSGRPIRLESVAPNVYFVVAVVLVVVAPSSRKNDAIT